MAQQRRILITGASRGLGLAMVEQLAEQDHTVIGCARGASAIERLAERFGPPHRFDVVDVSQDEQVGAWAESVLADGGPPDLLLNNAALVNENAPLWDVPPDEFSRVMQVNVNGVYHVVRHFVPAMIGQGRGVIVNFSSGWGRSTSPDVAPYCATKWAIEGLTRAMAEELPRGMAAVPLNPGIIHTQMLDTCFGEAAAGYPKPSEWAAKAVPFLLRLGAKDNGTPLSVPD